VIAGRYTLESEIGRGGMGAVWLARDEVLGRHVALKRIGSGPGGSDLDLDRAEREARLAARLNHPHVVAVYDLVTEGAERWLVMEYVAGATLAELVRRDGALSPDQAAPLLRQAADALAAAHTARIVHRDVKPSNILVAPDGQAKLSDFGIARAQADASLTQTGLVTGSPAYLAPEVASGQQATAASDVWSLGATMYHALSGRPPYDLGDNVLGALYRIVHEEPPRLGAVAGWLAPVLLATMAQRPEDRWSMAHVRDFLAAGPAAPLPAPLPQAVPVAVAATADPSSTQVLSVRGLPPVAPAPASAPSPGRPARRRGVLVALVALVVVAVVVAVIAWLLGSDGGSGADPETPSSSRSTPASSTPPTKTPVTADGMERFIDQYLTTVTSDPKAAWEQLTPQFQKESGGFGQYKKFWGGIQAAELLDAQPDPETLSIEYTVKYLHQDGTTSTDDVHLQLVGTDGDFLIAGES
jgi:eukaryotic-like serine/threonine-protein kinase